MVSRYIEKERLAGRNANEDCVAVMRAAGKAMDKSRKGEQE